MGYVVSSYIDGLSVNSAPLKACDIYNPAWGDVIGHVNFASHSTCDAAIAAGLRAWPNWASTPPHKRAQVLFKFRELLERYQLDLANMVTREHGKKIADAKGSIARAIELIEFHCGLLTQLQGSLALSGF